MTDLKISQLPDGGGFVAGDAIAVARSGVSKRASPIGLSVLVYRYTVSGADKASIDTGVDAPDAGSNDWTNGDVLDFMLYSRTDEATSASNIILNFNNDTAGGHYLGGAVRGQNTTASSLALATAGILFSTAGATTTAGVFGVASGVVPNFGGTVGFKGAVIESAVADVPDVGNNVPYEAVWSGTWKSTSAITRLSLTPFTAGKKLKVGTQLLIYKRLAS